MQKGKVYSLLYFSCPRVVIFYHFSYFCRLNPPFSSEGAWIGKNETNKCKQTVFGMDKWKVYCILLCALFSGWGNSARAQADKAGGGIKSLWYQGLNNDSVLAAFRARFDVLAPLMEQPAVPEGGWILSRALPMADLDSVYDAKSAYERKAFKRKHGLEITGQAYYRLDDNLGLDEEDQYSRYKAKFQGELGWNLFNSSFLQRKTQLRLIDLTNQAECLREQKQFLVPTWERAEEAIDRHYDALSIAVLREQRQNIEVLNMAYLYVLEKDRASNEKLLDVVNEKMRIEHALAQAGGLEPDKEAAIIVLKPVLIEVDSARLISVVREQAPEVREALTRERMLDEQIRLTNYAHGMRLTPFVRVSHYWRTLLPSSTNVEVGARFTFPLYGDASSKRRALRTEQAVAALERENHAENLEEQCRRLLDQLDRLNRALEAEQRHAEELRRFIDFRTEGYLKSLGGYNHIARLEEYNEVLKSLERTYSLLRLRSLCLLDMQRAAGGTNLAGMIKTKEIKP